MDSIEHDHHFSTQDTRSARRPRDNSQPHRRSKQDYPDRELVAEIKFLLLRCGIQPTRTYVNSVKAMTAAEAERKRGTLIRAAMAAEQAREQHPDGPRTTDKQLADWYRWHQANRHEPDAAEITRFLNLDRKTANEVTTAVRWKFWERQDRAGDTPQWRYERGLYSSEAVEQGNAERASQRRLRLDEM